MPIKNRRSHTNTGGPVEPPPPDETNAEWIAGTWILNQQETVQSVIDDAPVVRTALANPDINGYSVRVRWNQIEKTEGVYTWDILNEARDQHPNAKLAIRFMAGVHTPSFHKGGAGYTYQVNSAVYGGMTACPKPWNGNGVKGNYGNPDFEAGHEAMVEAFTGWAMNNNVRFVHLSQYGHLWAEMFYGDELQNAWKSDFNVPNEVTASATSPCAIATQNAHKTLALNARQHVQPNIIFELPASGYSSQFVSGVVFSYIKSIYAVEQFCTQGNTWGGPYRNGRVNGINSGMYFGYQSYFTRGPTSTNPANNNTLDWRTAFTGLPGQQYPIPGTTNEFLDIYNVNAARCLYTEVYWETFENATDRAALFNVLSTFNYNPLPVP